MVLKSMLPGSDCLLVQVQIQYHLTFMTKQRLPESITFWQTYYRQKAIGKVHPVPLPWRQKGEATLVLDGVGWLMPCPSCFTPREWQSAHCKGGWVGLRAETLEEEPW